MRAGAIAFYTNSHEIRNQLLMMNMSFEQLTMLSDEEFAKSNNVVKEAVLLLLLTHTECWGYVAKKINRRNGQTAWRIVNHKDNFTEVADDVIYLVLNLEDYDFKHWDEMSSVHTLAYSKGGSPIRKTPSKEDKKRCVKSDFSIFKNSKLLHHLVESKEPYYNKSHPFNSQWNDYAPYYKPMSDYNPKSHFKSLTSNPYTSKLLRKDTLHAIPFLRTNIIPTKVSLWIKPKTPVEVPRLFVNFPQGIPLKL
jgi:hypothetical protein